MWTDDQLAGLQRQLRETRRERAFFATMDRLDRRSRRGVILLGTILVALGIAVWVRVNPILGLVIAAGGLGFTVPDHLPLGWVSPRVIERLPFFRGVQHRLDRSSKARRAWTQLATHAPTAATDADYGPNGRQVARLLALIEGLTPAQWDRLRAITMRSAEKWLGESRKRHAQELAVRERSIERRISQTRAAPWDAGPEAEDSESDWGWAYLAALRRLADVRVSGELPSELALMPIRRALKALVQRGSIDESEFLADWAPLGEAGGPDADDVLRS